MCWTTCFCFGERDLRHEGIQNQTSIMQAAVVAFYFPTAHPTRGAQRSCSFGSQPLPSLVSPLAVAGAGHLQVTLSAQEQEGSWGSTFPVLQAEQHLQCLPRTARVWLGVLIPLQSLPCLGKECCEHGPAFLSMEPSSIPTSLSC